MFIKQLKSSIHFTLNNTCDCNRLYPHKTSELFNIQKASPEIYKMQEKKWSYDQHFLPGARLYLTLSWTMDLYDYNAVLGQAGFVSVLTSLSHFPSHRMNNRCMNNTPEPCKCFSPRILVWVLLVRIRKKNICFSCTCCRSNPFQVNELILKTTT